MCPHNARQAAATTCGMPLRGLFQGFEPKDSSTRSSESFIWLALANFVLSRTIPNVKVRKRMNRSSFLARVASLLGIGAVAGAGSSALEQAIGSGPPSQFAQFEPDFVFPLE